MRSALTSTPGMSGSALGPVQMQFAGQAAVIERDHANKTIVVDASGADEKGRGQANLGLTARLVPTATGTRVEVEQDLQLSGAAAQYGRGMISDVSAMMMRDFATNMQARIDAYDRGVVTRPDPDEICRWLRNRHRGRLDGPQTCRRAGSFSRTSQTGSEEALMTWWWIGNAVLLLVVVPVLVALLNRVLAASERIRGASNEILAGGVALIGEVDRVPELLAVTDQTIEDVSTGAVRYAGSVASCWAEERTDICLQQQS